MGYVKHASTIPVTGVHQVPMGWQSQGTAPIADVRHSRMPDYRPCSHSLPAHWLFCLSEAGCTVFSRVPGLHQGHWGSGKHGHLPLSPGGCMPPCSRQPKLVPRAILKSVTFFCPIAHQLEVKAGWRRGQIKIAPDLSV